MVFRKINYRGKKLEIRTLLRERQDIQRKIRYYKNKIERDQNKLKELEEQVIVEVEKKLRRYLGNDGI